jgi:hypothetical protein
MGMEVFFFAGGLYTASGFVRCTLVARLAPSVRTFHPPSAWGDTT